MHDRIYQVSIQPIEVDDYASPSDFYDNHDDYADYIGDAFEDDARKDEIKNLASSLSDIFDLDKSGEALIFKGMGTFLEKWVDAIHKAASNVTTENILGWQGRWDVRSACNETHLKFFGRFNIVHWNGDVADPLSELVSYIAYIAGNMKPGDKLYIGAVIDYHY